MANSKIQLSDGTVLMDLTSDTVTADKLLSGITAHDKSGASIIGTLASGGLPSGISKFDFGVYRLSSAVRGGQSFNVPHNLGVSPDFVIFFADGNISSTYTMLLSVRSTKMNYRSGYHLSAYHGNSASSVTPASHSDSYGIKTLTATNFTVTTYSNSTSYYWRAGTYNYIAIKFA